jgi:uncharacterized protein (TIGR02117 family)
MRFLRRLFKIIFYILSVPVVYIGVALILTAITVNTDPEGGTVDRTIYLNTNGVHLEIIIAASDLVPELRKGLNIANANYIAFGWGEENFYVNTPTWADLTFKNAFRALFLENSTLMHLTRYTYKRPTWTNVGLSQLQLRKMNIYILDTFKTGEDDSKFMLSGIGYTDKDDFYMADGRYSCFKTCNSWVNSAFKESGLKSCLWTPFDFGLLNKHKK